MGFKQLKVKNVSQISMQCFLWKTNTFITLIMKLLENYIAGEKSEIRTLLMEQNATCLKYSKFGYYIY